MAPRTPPPGGEATGTADDSHGIPRVSLLFVVLAFPPANNPTVERGGKGRLVTRWEKANCPNQMETGGWGSQQRQRATTCGCVSRTASSSTKPPPPASAWNDRDRQRGYLRSWERDDPRDPEKKKNPSSSSAPQRRCSGVFLIAAAARASRTTKAETIGWGITHDARRCGKTTKTATIRQALVGGGAAAAVSRRCHRGVVGGGGGCS